MKTRIFVVLCVSFLGLLFLFSFWYLDVPVEQAVSAAVDDASSEVATEEELSPADELLEKARGFIEAASYDSARVYAQQAQSLYDVNNDKRGITKSVNVHGESLRKKGMLEEAYTLLKEYADKAENWFGDNDLDYANICSEIGVIFHRQGDYESSLTYYLRALEIQQNNKVALPGDIAKSLNLVGMNYADRGFSDEALNYYTQALNIQQDEFGRDHLDVAHSYNSMGNLYGQIGDYARSLDFHRQSLAIRQKILEPIHLLVAGSIYNIGTTFTRLGEPEIALSFHKKSLKIFEEVLGKDHFYVFMNMDAIGSDYQNMKEYNLGLKYKKETLALKEKFFPPGSFELEVTLHNLGSSYLAKSEFAKAKEYYERALQNALYNFGENHPVVTNDYNALSGFALKTKSYDEALHYAEKAIQSNLITISPQVSSLDIEQHLTARELLLSLITKSDVYYERSQTKQDDGAISDLHQSLDILKQLMQAVQQYRQSFRADASKFLFAEQAEVVFSLALAVTSRLHALTREEKYLKEAFHFMEQSKVTVLLDALNESDARRFAQLPDSLLAYEKELRTNLTFYDQELKGEKVKGSRADSLSVARLETKVFELKRSYNSLLDSLEINYPDYYNLKYRNFTASIEDVRSKLLDEDEALIEYFAGGDSLYILAITDDDIKLAYASHDSLLNGQVEAFRSAIINKDQAQYSAAGYALFQRLIAPVLDTIEDKPHWIIAPHGELNYVPFEALPTAPFSEEHNLSKIPYVLRDHSFRYVYSSTIEVNSKENKSQTWAKDFIAFAPVFEDGIPRESAGAQLLSGRRSKAERVEFVVDGETVVWPSINDDSTGLSLDALSDGWGYLPYTQREVEDIRQLFRGSYSWTERLWGNKASVLLQEEATEAALKSTDLTKHRFVHFATHGAINESTPELSGIVLAQDTTGGEDGVLHLGEIYNLELNADLVVLSACETGLGKLVGGEGIIGLARGFKYAGANALLVSLWPVDDSSTRKLMTSFYDDVLKGKAKAEAVQAAKLNLITHYDQLNHPFYWAGFILIGE